ncbi:hypothetical protein [Haloferula sargassicola]|uniref:PEP-CTERM protein-sorting domain-containing protein n=1 Tax=Haloferula sargassicola TaxID=490096 RepID=A0ABP9UPK5_9BACT
MKGILFPLSVLFGTVLPLSAQLVIEEVPWGADAYGYVSDRFGSSVSTGTFNFPSDGGGAGIYSDSASLTETRGSISSSVVLNNAGGISVPEIHTYAATANSNSVANAAATGIEGYTYTGSTPKMVSLDVSLSGSYSNMDNDYAGNFARVSVWSDEVLVAMSSTELFSASALALPGFFFSTDTGAYLEYGFLRYDQLDLEMNGIGTDDVTSGTLSWMMNPGDTVYLHAQGNSTAYGPNSVADASHTLTMSFQDSTGLVALSGGITVPEPGPAAIGALGVAVFLILRRRH